MKYKVVTKSSKKLNIREAPSTQTRVTGYLYKDNIYDIEKINDEWGYYSGYYKGYVSMDYLQPVYNPVEIVDNSKKVINIEFTEEELYKIITYINNLLKE